MVQEVAGCVGEIVSTCEVESKGRVGISIPSKNVLDAFPISCLVLCANHCDTSVPDIHTSSTSGVTQADNNAVPPTLRIPSEGLNDWLNSYDESPQTVDISTDDLFHRAYQHRQQEQTSISVNVGLPPKSRSPRLKNGLSTYLWLRSKPSNNLSQEDSPLRESDSPDKNTATRVEGSASKLRHYVQAFEAPAPPTPPPTKSRNKRGESIKISKEPKPRNPASTVHSDASSSHHFDGTLFSAPTANPSDSQRTRSASTGGNPQNPKQRPKSARAGMGSSSPRLKSYGRNLPREFDAGDFNPVATLRESTLKALEKAEVAPTVATRRELLNLDREFNKLVGF